MPTLRQHKEQRLFKAICIGDSGTGKTGALVEVINHMDELGLKQVIIADYDDGLDILSERVDPKHMDRVYYQLMRDQLNPDLSVGSKLASSQLESAWGKLVRNMTKWPDDIGPINQLGPESLFVGDSLSGLGDMAMNYSLVYGDKTGSRWQATGGAMGLQDGFLQLCAGLRCHFILTSHVRYMGGGGFIEVEDKHGSQYRKEVDTSEGKALPSALGRQLPGNVAKTFNIMLEFKLNGNRRVIRTQPDVDGRMATKLPLNFPTEVPQENGLYRIMMAFLGKETK